MLLWLKYARYYGCGDGITYSVKEKEVLPKQGIDAKTVLK
jgi:hypothetical protein